MENRSSRLGAPGLVAALAALLLALCALACPATAMGDDEYIAHSKGDWGRTYNYATVEDAIEDGYNGRVIVMDKDWDLGSASIDLADSKSVTIDMNGHRITSSNKDATFYLNEHASLKLISSADAKDYAYRGYDNSINNWNDLSIKTSGLVTNTKDGQGNATGVHMEKESSVTLENVAVAGCGSGGIYTKEGCSITLSNASVSHCARAYTSKGGGAGIQLGASSTLAMSASHVDGNYCKGCRGGGIFAEKSTTITMEEGSTVSGNCAGFGGGGIYLNGTYFTLKSEDRTGTVAENSCLDDDPAGKFDWYESGGGIHVDAVSGDNASLIEGITIKDNFSGFDGGGIELDQRWTTVRDCTITGNHANYDGGGVFVHGGNNLIENCTITGNWCATKKGSCEGGGVFVGYKYDLKMSGTCIVKGNTRNEKDSGNADDVFLSTLSGGGGKAYITGSLAKGSTVGVRTGIEGDRRIAKSFKPETKDCLFYDMDGYYVSYGSDEGGDAWQRHATREFLAQVNGEGSNRYKWNSPVTLVAPLAKGDDRLFWFWDPKYTTGLYPVGDYITKDNVNSNTLAFKMPQNDVDANAVYATRATKVVVGIEAPAAGEDLPVTAVVCRADGIGGAQEFPAAVTWYEVVDGKRSDAPAAGKAKAGTAYAASVTCAQSQQGGLCFSKSFAASGVTVKALSGGDAPAAASASVDADTGALTVVTEAFAATGDGAPAAKTGTVTVSKEEGGLEDAFSGKGQAASSEPMPFSLAADQGPDGSLGSVEISYAYDGDTDEVTITAPAQNGYNFCNWEDVPDGITRDDGAGTLTVPASMLGDALEVTAVYTPVVTEVELSMSAPRAGGDDLSADAGEVRLTCSNGEAVDLAGLFGVEGLPVTWSPEGEDGKAGYSTEHTAMIKVAEGAGELVDVDKVVSADASVAAANGVEAEGAGFALLDGDLYLCVTFPETPVARVTGISQPTDVELAFDEAKACAELGIWPLAKAVDVTVQSGVAAEGNVEWQAVEGFDADATGAQELTAHGTVTRIATADDSEIDANGLSREVTCKIKVAAPSQDGGSGTAQASGSDTDDGGKSALAKTSDSILVFAVAAIAAAAAIAIAAAAVSARCRRG